MYYRRNVISVLRFPFSTKIKVKSRLFGFIPLFRCTGTVKHAGNFDLQHLASSLPNLPMDSTKKLPTVDG